MKIYVYTDTYVNQPYISSIKIDQDTETTCILLGEMEVELPEEFTLNSCEHRDKVMEFQQHCAEVQYNKAKALVENLANNKHKKALNLQ